MSATPRLIEPPGDEPRYSPVWPARYPGTCGNCGQSFDVGDEIRRDGGTIVGTMCCTIDGPREPDHTPEVMPRGKTARDRCDRCFIVHGTGQVECE